MPIYVYECLYCDAKKEVIKSFSRCDEEELCERCEVTPALAAAGTSRPPMKKILFPGGTSNHFGRGFFKTGGY